MVRFADAGRHCFDIQNDFYDFIMQKDCHEHEQASVGNPVFSVCQRFEFWLYANYSICTIKQRAVTV